MSKKNQIVLQCKFCGKLYSRALSISITSKFCSSHCQYAYRSSNRKPEVHKKCPICGVKFTTSQYKDNEKTFCSRQCSAKNRSTSVTKKCIKCGKLFTVKKGNKKGYYCSHSCAAKSRVGSKNPAWKGGVTPLLLKIRNSSETAEWRSSIMERDKFTCLKCNTIGGNLNVHHLLTFKDFKKARFNINNGLTLCKECHLDFHKSYGFRNTSPEDVINYLSDYHAE